eukprot:2589-Eustigmatos_ZCMA.PRE.1
MPDAPELIEKFIKVSLGLRADHFDCQCLTLKFAQAETDGGARRNAFLMLCSEAEGLAIEFLAEHLEDVPKYGDGFALLVLELTRKVCRKDP